MQIAIELDGPDRYQCSAPAWHGGVLIVLDESGIGLVACIESSDRQVAAGQDHEGSEGVRCKEVMQQDDREEDIQSLHEDAAGCCA